MTLVTPPSGPDFDVTDYEALAYYRREPGFVVHDGTSGPLSPAPVVPSWLASVSYAAGQVVQHPTSTDIYLRRIAQGVSRGSFDATEAALWKASGSATYVPVQATSGSAGIHRNTDSLTYGQWFTVGTTPDSMGFAGTGVPAEAYAPLVIYQDYGDKAGGSNAPILKTTQARAALANYWGPTADDSMECGSDFVAAKNTGTAYAQTKAITASESIVQVETGVTATTGDTAPALSHGSRVNVLGTAHVGTAVGFKTSVNSSGGPGFGTIDKYIAFWQPAAAAANGGTVTTAYGLYVVDAANSETALTLGDGAGTYFSAKKAGNTDTGTSLVLVLAPAGSNLTTMTLRAVAGQAKHILDITDSGGTTRAQFGAAGNFLMHGQSISVESSGSVSKLVIDPATNLVTVGDAVNIVLNTVTGTKIGTAAAQKLGFYNAAPVVQPSGTPAAATDLASVITLANSLRTNLLALGLVA